MPGRGQRILAGAAALLLAGVAVARADELSDLRANSRALQQRLDQIKREQAAAPATDPRPDAGAVGGGNFPRSFLVPGTDTSIRIGGDVDEFLGYRVGGP